MVFTSNVFLFLFLPVFLAVYYSVKPQWRSLVIVTGSYSFYAWWRPDFLFLFVAITYWNYFFGGLIADHVDTHKKKAFRLLTIGVIGNLSVLGYFKYANFGVEVIAAALKPLGIDTWTLETIILPMGISFYIFHSLSYMVDLYRKEAERANNFIDFAAFVSLFPHQIAGPILRYQLIDQQLKHREHSWDIFSLGVARFMLGFVKKVLIADSLAPLSGHYMSSPELGAVDAWFGTITSLIQLYFDFSGYSDMAIGLGLMMGIRFPENFNQPFMCMSLTEFWRRWHLTLADFLKEYVYKPLLKSGIVKNDGALIFTMLVSGIWHGASFAFIFFGLSFAFFMVIERRLGWATGPKDQYNLVKNIIAMTVVLCIMPMFTTGDTPHALTIYASMFGANGVGSIDHYILATSNLAVAFVGIAVIWLVAAGVINRRFYSGNFNGYFMQSVTGYKAIFLWAAFLVAVSRLAANSFSPFLYFQF